jgi:hypothetical protein
MKTAAVLEREARYLLSVACLVKDAGNHDELQKKPQGLNAEAEKVRGVVVP